MVAPKLRFKEFDGDYLELKYDKFAPLQRGFDLPVSTIVDGDFPVVFSNGILKKHNEFKAKAPGVVTGRSGTIGNITWVEKDYWPHNTSLWVTNFFGNEPKYIFYFLQEFDVSRFASGSGVPTLNRNDVHAQLINIPNNKEEQTKIASFLSAVDEKISQLNQKHELLSQYKQGMMQKLFSQQIRFKADDGSDFGEWEEVRLGNLVDLTSGFAFKSDFFSEDGNKLITPKNFTTTGKANFTDTNTKWTTEISDKKYICRPNDLLVLLTDLTQSCELLGKPILLSQDDGNVLLNQRIVKIIPNRKLEKPFLLYLLLTDDFHELIVSTASGTTVKHSSNKVLQNFHFYLPCLEEQTKIANFLSAIDQKIEVVAQQIEQAKQWKKGLLQQMFV